MNFTKGQLDRMSWILDMYKKDLKLIAYSKYNAVKFFKKNFLYVKKFPSNTKYFLFPGPCSIDAVFRWSDGRIYFFFGTSYYGYNETTQSIDSRYPRAISDHWRGVPNNIDGVFRYSDDITYFFKGSEYYRFNDSTLQVDPGYPKKIKDFWKGIPNDIDDVIK